MKLIKLTTEHYIIVDDSEIKEGDYCCHLVTKNIIQQHSNSYYGDWKKITHSTQPLEKCENGNWRLDKIQPLFISEIKELLGEIDVKKKAVEKYLMEEGNWQMNSVTSERRRSFIEGYNQALEDNKDKKYTEEDMRKAFENGVRTILLNSRGQYTSQKEIEQVFEESLQPPTSWEVEFVNGKLKLI